MRRRLTWFLGTVVLGAGAYASTLLATPSTGFTPTTLARATFDETDLNAHTLPANFWQARLKTKGLSDLYVQSNVWKPGGTTGWHTHPGPSLIIVTAGTITAYDGDDPTCTPHVYSQGMGPRRSWRRPRPRAAERRHDVRGEHDRGPADSGGGREAD